ncbi:hypothetical protein METHP14_320017 [Pseudomonas sp. P14-2025]
MRMSAAWVAVAKRQSFPLFNEKHQVVTQSYPYGYTHSRIEVTHSVVFELNQEFRHT